jgi:hypothetical protein
VCTITGLATAVAGSVRGAGVVIEDADRSDRVIRRIDYVVGVEAGNIADNRDRSLLDPSRELFRNARLRLALTNGCAHRLPSLRADLPRRMGARTGAGQGLPPAVPTTGQT